MELRIYLYKPIWVWQEKIATNFLKTCCPRRLNHQYNWCKMYDFWFMYGGFSNLTSCEIFFHGDDNKRIIVDRKHFRCYFRHNINFIIFNSEEYIFLINNKSNKQMIFRKWEQKICIVKIFHKTKTVGIFFCGFIFSLNCLKIVILIIFILLHLSGGISLWSRPCFVAFFFISQGFLFFLKIYFSGAFLNRKKI